MNPIPRTCAASEKERSVILNCNNGLAAARRDVAKVEGQTTDEQTRKQSRGGGIPRAGRR
jgi:hypothetical protein